MRRRWTVAAVFAFCVITATILSFAATPLYKATALIEIQPTGPNIVSFEDVQQSDVLSQAYYDFFQTQYDILSSRALAHRTIDEMGLEDDPWLNGDEETAKRLRTITAFLGGHATLMRASVEARESLQVFEPEPPARAGLTRTVKAAFDPHRLFNPSRMFRNC